MANFIENGTSGHPAIALIAVRQRKIRSGSGWGRASYIKVETGFIRAVALIPQGLSANEAMKEARHSLLSCIQNSLQGNWSKNWRVARGVSTEYNGALMHFEPLSEKCDYQNV